MGIAQELGTTSHTALPPFFPGIGGDRMGPTHSQKPLSLPRWIVTPASLWLPLKAGAASLSNPRVGMVAPER